jgi:hypothetical protein
MSNTTDPVSQAREGIREALAQFFTTKAALLKLSRAVEECMVKIQPLLRLESTRKGNNGATVMTQDASHRGDDGSFLGKPRNL